MKQKLAAWGVILFLPLRNFCSTSIRMRIAIEHNLLWDEAFSNSPDTLGKLSASAMAECHAGKTQELDPETFLMLNITHIRASYVTTDAYNQP